MKKIKKSTPEMILPDFCTEIASVIRLNLVPEKTREKLSDYHEKDIAMSLSLLTREEGQRLFRILPPDTLAVVLEYADNNDACFAWLSARKQADALTRMESAAAAALMQKLPAPQRASLLELLDPETRRELRLIGSFDETEIGSRMSTDFIRIPAAASVKEAMSELVRQAAEHHNISTLYLVDDDGAFCGAIDLKDLIIARDGTPLSDLATVSFPYLYARTEIEDCIPFFTDYAETSIPVLDDDNRLIGIVPAQDFVELLDDSLSSDYARLGGLSAEEDLREPIARSIRKRLPWLCILLVLGMVVSATVGLFESIVAQLPVILCFQSLILDMAGNVGTQSLAVAIRALSDTQLRRRQKATLVIREARIGFLNGCLLGVLSFGVIGAYLCLCGHAPDFAFATSACLGVAMMIAMVISALSGTLIPLFFQRVGVDPAVASGPLITTVNDLVAVVTYYGLAWLILLRLLHAA